MALKGHAYTKTSWAYEERPVASAKLNLWDDRIEQALELIHFLICQAWGGGNGVIRGATSTDLSVTPASPPGLFVRVNPGYAFISRYPYRLSSTTETPSVQLPTIYSRIDLVQARLLDWHVGIKAGAEAASPVAPAPDADCIALAELHLKPGMTCIKSTNDGVNGYITDVRNYV